jgi:hypothetical protein
MTMLKSIRNRFRRWRFREGRTLSGFIACDIRRDILIVSSAKIDDGIIIGRIRTTNVLYVSRGLIPEPDFEPARELRLDEIWHWTGKGWGGLPDGTSIVDRVAGLAPFQDCRGLTYLDVSRGMVTAKGVEAFHAAVPACKIDHDGGTIAPKK